MVGHNSMRFLITIFFASLAAGSAMAAPFSIKAAYWPSDSGFPVSAIDTSLFTHIYYAFLMPNNITFKFNLLNSTAVLLSNFTTTLHHKNPPAKVMVSIGGGGSDSSVFARMTANASSRGTFINSAIEVGRKFGFDGLDLDWEFPQGPKEMEDLGYLLDEWRAAIQTEANVTSRPPLLLTAAVYFKFDVSLDEVYRSYPVASIAKNTDWINAMCFDYHGSWNTSVTGAHAALFDPKSNLSTSYGLKSWIMAGVPQSKLVMGLPLYGKTWQLKEANSTWVGAPAVGLGPGDQGIMTFSQIEEFNTMNGATVAHDVDTVSTYSFVGTTWIGYDDELSVTVKIGFAQTLGLRGYFFWAVNGDNDFKISKQASRAWILE